MKITCLLVAALIVVAGCGEAPVADASVFERADTAATPAAAARPAPDAADDAGLAAATPMPATDTTPAVDELAGFMPDEVLAVVFKEINERGFPIVTLTNLTGRDIDDIRGSFRLLDADGSILHSTGMTSAVPGDVFLAAGATDESSPFGLNRRSELMKRLATAPEGLSFVFEANAVTFVEHRASAE
ncbi:MAG: hypothetical protein ACYTGR_02675 [Planctomycetota bacterium]|jgi:hypothetical protein